MSHETYFREHPDRRAVADPAHFTAVAVSHLLDAAPRRSRTIQWMPERDGCRFEVIDVQSGAVVAEAHIGADGGMRWLEVVE